MWIKQLGNGRCGHVCVHSSNKYVLEAFWKWGAMRKTQCRTSWSLHSPTNMHRQEILFALVAIMVSNLSTGLYITVCSTSPKVLVLVSRSWTHNLSHPWDIRVISSCLQTVHLRLNNCTIYKLTCFPFCLLRHEFETWATRRTLLPLAADSWEPAIRSSVVGRGEWLSAAGLQQSSRLFCCHSTLS